MDSPLLVLVFSFVILWLSTQLGARLRGRLKDQSEAKGDFDLVLGATLTLLGLIIGFSFSMAISRYDQRKNYEEEEANAIGTEYLRADLLPGDNALKLRTLLRWYLDQRILFYQTRDVRRLESIDTATSQLQSELWSAVQRSASANATPLTALAVSGMNEVLNSQGYTQAAWWNRIPKEAWGLMGLIAICSHVLLGYSMHPTPLKNLLFVVLPLVLSISFWLIDDIESPRKGLILVYPQNLLSLSQSLRP